MPRMRVYGPIRPLWKKINKQRKTAVSEEEGSRTNMFTFSWTGTDPIPS